MHDLQECGNGQERAGGEIASIRMHEVRRNLDLGQQLLELAEVPGKSSPRKTRKLHPQIGGV